MIKAFFLGILVLHGLLHLIGFYKAFRKAEVLQLSGYIPRPLGVLWFITGVLFLLVAVLVFLNKEGWPFFAAAGFLLSQVLILISWSDAKYGTLLNAIILIATIPALGEFYFEKMVDKEVRSLREQVQLSPAQEITMQDVEHLPPVVQKWMLNSGVIGQFPMVSGRVEQVGRMRTEPAGKWMDFEAEQYFNLQQPAFIWTADVKAAPGIGLRGRDKFWNGKGEMLIKALSLVKVVDEKDTHQINSGSMVRFLAELCWFPAAANLGYLSWEQMNDTSAKAIFILGTQQAEGIFTFTEEGKIISFEALRYFGTGEDAREEKWLIEAVEHKNFSGVTVPSKCRVTWKLTDGDFHWLDLEVTHLEYNI